MRTILRTAALSAVALMTATACGGQASPAGGQGPDPADAELTVVTGVYPLEWLAHEVGGDRVAVLQLTEPGMEPHDLELTGRQIGQLTEADLAFYVAGLQPAIDEAVEQEAADRALDVADVVELHPVGDDGGHEHEEGDAHGHEDEHADEDGHGHEDGDEHAEEEAAGEESGGDGHDHGDLDPHFWLDVDLMSEVAGALGERLGELDPEGAEGYTANAEAVAAELAAIGQEYEEGLASCEHHEVVVGHTAFSYLTEHYGLEQVGISGVDPDSEPSPSQIAEIADFVREHGVTTIFTEPLMPEETAQTIAGETGAAVEVLDPLEGVTDASPGDDYPSIMRGNLEALRTALVCA